MIMSYGTDHYHNRSTAFTRLHCKKLWGNRSFNVSVLKCSVSSIRGRAVCFTTLHFLHQSNFSRVLLLELEMYEYRYDDDVAITYSVPRSDLH